MARQEKNIHYIYKTTCTVTSRYYIGMHSTDNLNDGYMGSGKRLRRSLRKYGKPNHVKEILEFCETRELLIEAEIKVITLEMITDNNCMNLMGGGKGGYISEEHYEKIKKLASDYQKEKWKNESYVQNFVSAATKALKKRHDDGKQSIPNWTGKNHSEETKRLMSSNKKGQGIGEANSQYGTCWITKDGINKKIKKDNLTEYLNDSWEKGRK